MPSDAMQRVSAGSSGIHARRQKAPRAAPGRLADRRSVQVGKRRRGVRLADGQHAKAARGRNTLD